MAPLLRSLALVFSLFIFVGAASVGPSLRVEASSAEPAEPAEPPVPAALGDRPLPWVPPLWFPAPVRERLWVLPSLDAEPSHAWGPRVDAHGAILADLDRGEVLWARDPDGPRGIASVTKLFSSLALMSADRVDLERPRCVGFAQWPSRPGARSIFETGDCHEGWEYLGAALVASDNRGAFALPSVAGVDYFRFVDRMQQVARDLGARTAEFGDPAGLEDDNRASPRDVLKAVVAVAAHPTLSTVASAPYWQVEPSRGLRTLYSTNRLLRDPGAGVDVIAAKTGYTDTARYCFAAVLRSQHTGRTYGVVVLASPHGRTRWADVRHMVDWAEHT